MRLTNGRRHLGARGARYADRQQFITPRIDVTSRDKVCTAVNMRPSGKVKSNLGGVPQMCAGDGAVPKVIAKSRSVDHPTPFF